MSIDSTSTSSQLPTFKQHSSINLHHTKPLHSTLSATDHIPMPRLSFKSSSKDHHHHQQQHQKSHLRTRTLSASGESTNDTIAPLATPPANSNKCEEKRDRRQSELKSSAERHDHTPIDRRNSTPQIHLSAFFPHAFRNPKHHHKTNTKDETNTTNITSSSVNAYTASSLQFPEMTTVKADLPFSLKSSTLPANGSRLITSHSSERLLLSSNDDSISSTSFTLDENIFKPRSAELFIFESHIPLCVSGIYLEQFFDHFHTNYYGEFDEEGPFIASLRHIYHKSATSLTETCEAHAIIRTQYRNCHVSETVDETNENNILQILFTKANMSSVRSYGTVGDPKANEKIYLFDKTNDDRYNFKIGVIYQRSNQTNEYDILSNDYVPQNMHQFLHGISDQITLKGFQKYRGDLDIKDDLHGEYSYYTRYDNHEIMFNIAPLIPTAKSNGHYIERKSLIGNAFVCVVFQEAGAIFSPDCISGKVVQIYITVQPTLYEDELYYKIGIWRRNNITAVIDPPGGTYKFDKAFRSYFLTLLLNALNVAIESPSLRSQICEPRQQLKCAELKKLSHLFTLGPIPDFATTTDIDNYHYSLETRPQTRSESFASNVTATTSDSASTTPGRISPGSSKKKGFPRKIFNVFTSRSASISSPSVSFNHINNDGIPINQQTSSILDTTMSSGRAFSSFSKEPVKRTRSIKTNQAPIPPSRPINTQVPPHSISINPPTPTVVPLNPFLSENLTQNNSVNTAALNIAPRNRSNSSPEDVVNMNKIQTHAVHRIVEEDDTTSTSDDDDDEEEDTSEDE